MPFEPTTTITPNPDVRIFFEGLLLFEPGKGAGNKDCVVHAIHHHLAADHELSVTASLSDEPAPSFPFLNIGKKVIASGLEISPTTTPSGVKKYEPSGSPTPELPLHEAIDFHLLHSTAGVDNGNTHPGKITLKEGVIFSAKHELKGRLERGITCENRGPVGTILGAYLNFNGREIQIKWGPRANELLKLPRPDDGANAKYVILISNSRLTPPPPDTNDFPHLYHGIKGVPDNEKFNLTLLLNCGEKFGLNTPRIPCMPGIIDG